MARRTARRAIAAGFITLAAAVAGTPGSAEAADGVIPSPNCDATYLPDGVGGATIYVAGQPVRVPKIEDLNVCVRQDVVRVDLGAVRLHTGCGTPCFDVFAPAYLGDGSFSALVCWTNDGARQCTGADAPPFIYTSQACLLSVGQPAQQLPSSCLVVIDRDTLIPVEV